MQHTQHLSTSMISPILGSELRGIEVAGLLRPEGALRLAGIRTLIDERLVVLMPGQQLTPASFVAFAETFGRLPDKKPVPHVPEAPDIKIASNGRHPDGAPIGAGNAAELIWHADDSYRAQPPSYMFLYGIKIPARRPKTSWLSLHQIHDELDGETRSNLNGLQAIHAAIGSNAKSSHEAGDVAALAQRSEGTPHPLIRTHPATERASVFMPRRRDAIVLGRTSPESAALIGPLWDLVMGADHGCSIALDEGDLVMWDNRFTLHAREAWDDNEERTLWRLAVQ